MIIRVTAFSDKGRQLMNQIELEEVVFQPRGEEPLSEWARSGFEKRLPMLFIGACGIAVRTIAPFVKDKLIDSPVIVMDEKGEHVIPILSGHMGGANEIAIRLAKAVGGEAVLTTATDVEKTFAVDLFAKLNGLRIVNREGIVKVSSKALQEEPLTISIAPTIDFEETKLPSWMHLMAYPPKGMVDILIDEEDSEFENAVIRLIPKKYVLGIGCRKGKSFQELEGFVLDLVSEDFMKEAYAIASIDLKKEEEGLNEFAQYYMLPFVTFSAEDLQGVPGDYTDSEFVKNTTGVDNVCERSAVLLAGEGGKLIMRKQAKDGMTFAMAYRRPRIDTWETMNE